MPLLGIYIDQTRLSVIFAEEVKLIKTKFLQTDYLLHFESTRDLEDSFFNLLTLFEDNKPLF